MATEYSLLIQNGTSNSYWTNLHGTVGSGDPYGNYRDRYWITGTSAPKQYRVYATMAFEKWWEQLDSRTQNSMHKSDAEFAFNAGQAADIESVDTVASKLTIKSLERCSGSKFCKLAQSFVDINYIECLDCSLCGDK